MRPSAIKAQKVFKNQLAEYKKLIDDDITQYTEIIRSSSRKNYGEESLIAVDSYCAILNADGKRIRGVLALIGYDMMGGTDRELIIQAARALEMMQAYILVIDDIQDESNLRRGIPTAHRAVAAAHKKRSLKSNADHFGISLALNGALIGSHAANVILANLPTDESLRIKALSIMNHSMMVTAQGQTHDILNEVSPEPVAEARIDAVMQWKTAHYTILNPLHMGMVLAGAPCEDTNAITEYALNVGRAFQITDDLLIMSTDPKVGKSATDDIVEGKQTLLTSYVFENGTTTQQAALSSLLGNKNVTQAQLKECQDLFTETGAVAYAQARAQKHVDLALASLEHHRERWSPEPVEFLEGLAHYIINRTN